MKKFISLIIIMLSMMIFSVSCNTIKTISDIQTLGLSLIPSQIQTFEPDTINISQIDSVIAIDRLPDFKYWKQSTFRDFETNQSITYKTLYDPTTKMIYTVKPYNGKYIVFKKQTK